LIPSLTSFKNYFKIARIVEFKDDPELWPLVKSGFDRFEAIFEASLREEKGDQVGEKELQFCDTIPL
jgi:hypothetical protein